MSCSITIGMLITQTSIYTMDFQIETIKSRILHGYRTQLILLLSSLKNHYQFLYLNEIYNQFLST